MKITFDFDKAEEKYSTDYVRFNLALKSTQLASLIVDIKRMLEDQSQYCWERAYGDELDEDKVTDEKNLLAFQHLQSLYDYIDEQEDLRGVGGVLVSWEDTQMYSEIIADYDGEMDDLNDLIED